MHALLDIVLPVFGVILAGYGAGRFGVLGEASSEALNRFVYYFALPPLMFLAAARAPIAEVLNWPFVAAYMLGAALTLAATFLGSRYLLGVRDPASLVIHGLATSFANTAFMGIPLFVAAFGPAGALPAVIATMFATLILVGGAILLLDLATRERASGPLTGGIMGDLLRTLWRNPMLLAPFLGTLFAALGIGLPAPVTAFLDLLGAAAAPAALFAIGLTLHGQPLAGRLKEVAWLSLLKLLFQPAATWLLVRFVFRLDPLWANAVVLLAALPAGALVFVVAQRFQVRVATSSAVIVVTTALSLVTLTLLFAAMGTK